MILTNGCATIAAREHIVPIDSEPRGIAVYSSTSSDLQMGITPFFANLPRGYSQELTVSVPGGSRRSVENFHCGINWTTGVIGNGVLGGLSAISGGVGSGLVVMAAFSGLDALTGNFFSCSDGVMFKVKMSAAQKKKLENCRTFLFVPPATDDEKVSDLLLQRWMQTWKIPDDSCDAVVDPEASKQQLAFININHTHQTTFASISRKNLDYLGFYTRSNNIVILDLETKKGGGQMLRARTYDLLTGKEISVAQLPWAKAATQDIAARDNVSREARSTFISRSMSFFPNSISYTGGATEIVNFKSGDGFIEDGPPEVLRTFPRALAAISLYSVLHPDGYEDWELVGSLWPRIFTSSLDQNQMLKLEGTNELIKYRLRGFITTPFYEAAGTLHTPIGSFSLGLGAGPTIAYVDDNFSDGKVQMSAAFNVNVTYTAFMTKKLFFTYGIDTTSYSTGSYPGASAKYFRLERIQQMYVGIGYFMPEMRTKIRNWMGKP